jgi:hypothetical protein
MQVISLVWGILALVGMFIAFFPCLGSLNWLNIPFALIGLIVSIVALVQAKPEEKKSGSVAGICCCAAAVLFGAIRLMLGGGLL